jgi:hypothetical protein
MNHCIDCGRKVSCGRTHTTNQVIRCLVCQVARDMQGWRYQTPVMKLRRQSTEKQNA